ncbi:MAG TPA: two-component regulator propeller domain-containing protein, partial [Pelobium sp.]|nr:two-component regulator propeller domain-containing protein [Pelobium sp.]
SNFLQDEKGFIWFGNFKGLTRYDGYEFKNFKFNSKDTSTLSHNKVNVIFQDSEGRMWVGTANGLNLYNRKKENFERIDILNIKGGRNYISSIAEDKNKNIWIGTFGGLKKLNKATLRLEDISNYGDANESKRIFSLFVDLDNKMWVGTGNSVSKYDPVKKVSIPLPEVLTSGQNFATNKIQVIKEDSAGSLWFGTEISGAFKYDKKNNELINYSYSKTSNSIASNWVRDILIDNQQIWFATRNGVSILNTQTQKFSNYENDPTNANSLSDNTIWSFLKDKASCIWIGTFSGGINFYHKGSSNFENIGNTAGKSISLSHTLVEAITEDKDGAIWVGTFGGGLNYINRATNFKEVFTIRTEASGRTGNAVRSLSDDGKGNLWVGTMNGLAIFNKQSESFKYYNFFSDQYSKSETPILYILPDGEGAWLGTDGGGLRYVLPNGETTVFRYKTQNLTVKEFLFNFNLERDAILRWAIPEEFFVTGNVLFKDELADNFVTAILKDDINHLWLGTQNGLNYYNISENKIERTFQKVGDRRNQLTNSNVTTLFKDSKKRLWIGTEEGGLNYFDKTSGSFFSIGIKQGLKDDVIHAVVEDLNGNIWISTDLGIYKIEFRKFELPFVKKDLKITQYTANDGLISNQFSNNAGLTLSSGEIAFGGINGLSIFYPNKILKNTIIPSVVITNFTVNNRNLEIGKAGSPLSVSIVETESITLKHYQSNISIKYAGLSFINPENNEYAYRLIGLESVDDWQNVGTQRVVNFANLAPGTYNFLVKASNNDGVWGNDVKSLEIIILPPWWLTWWAYLIYVLIFCGIAYVIINFLRNKEALKRNLYIEHLQNERQNELYQMKINFFTNISHELRTPLTLILGPVEKLIHENKDINTSKSLNSIKSNADRLLSLVTELLDFRKVEEGHIKLYWTYEDIVPFCEEMFKSFEALASFKRINYKFEAPKKPLYVYFDNSQLQKVVFNLLSNAFKFTSNGGQVVLTVGLKKNDPALVEISVKDNGKGIPKELQDKLFDSFFQVDDRGTENIGSGIGLALAKSIMELHKGEIKVTSVEKPVKLTSFNIFLQTGRAHLQDSEIFEDKEAIAIEDTLNEEVPSESEMAEDVVRPYKIMIVEDNNEVRDFIADSLKHDYQIIECENGKVALDCVEQELPDLIVSDVMMPEVDGFELCSNIKSNDATNHIPFILLTAKASETNQLSGLNIGADVFISKPFSLQILKVNIRNLLKAQAVFREKFTQRIVLAPTNVAITSPEEKFLNKLMKIIDEKIDDSYFDVNELVNEIGMSRAALYKKVQTLTNYSVADLIKQMRLKKAAHLLKTTSFNVTEITYMVGFNHRKYFSKEFKKEFNMSPSEYAKLNQDVDS